MLGRRALADPSPIADSHRSSRSAKGLSCHLTTMCAAFEVHLAKNSNRSPTSSSSAYLRSLAVDDGGLLGDGDESLQRILIVKA
jgi:hypothetical protein